VSRLLFLRGPVLAGKVNLAAASLGRRLLGGNQVVVPKESVTRPELGN